MSLITASCRRVLAQVALEIAVKIFLLLMSLEVDYQVFCIALCLRAQCLPRRLCTARLSQYWNDEARTRNDNFTNNYGSDLTLSRSLVSIDELVSPSIFRTCRDIDRNPIIKSKNAASARLALTKAVLAVSVVDKIE